jgi:hypothetical protein
MIFRPRFAVSEFPMIDRNWPWCFGHDDRLGDRGEIRPEVHRAFDGNDRQTLRDQPRC